MLTRTRAVLRARRPILNQDRGFSLIELLVVVIIIGILAAIAIPVYINVQIAARDSAVKSDLVQAKNFMVQVYSEEGAYPADYAALHAAGFTGTASQSDYVVNFVLSNVSDDGFCIRAWADIDDSVRDLWVSAESGVVGPIAVADVAGRPAGC